MQEDSLLGTQTTQLHLEEDRGGVGGKIRVDITRTNRQSMKMREK